jgi:hypothetical protein
LATSSFSSAFAAKDRRKQFLTAILLPHGAILVVGTGQSGAVILIGSLWFPQANQQRRSLEVNLLVFLILPNWGIRRTGPNNPSMLYAERLDTRNPLKLERERTECSINA